MYIKRYELNDCVDYKKGFGGLFGVQNDRKDKCAAGWDDHEKLNQHESQTGEFLKCANMMIMYLFRLQERFYRKWLSNRQKFVGEKQRECSQEIRQALLVENLFICVIILI